MKRLYKTKDNPVYNDYVDKLMVQSQVLNQGAMNIGIHSVLMTANNMAGLLISLEGDENGDYMLGDNFIPASIPNVQRKIQELEVKFAEYQKKRVDEGYHKPAEMPVNMLNKLYQLQAQLTVFQAEAEVLKQRLQVYKDKETKENDDQFLLFGLRGISKFYGYFDAPNKDLINVLKTIDDQRVTQNPDGLLIINDTRSPYNGMSVPDYHKLCKAFYEQQRTKEKRKLEQVQEQARKEGKSIPVHLGAHGVMKVSKSSLPPFPVWAKNYLAESSPIRIRTK